jgi:hypothetical protein
VSPRPHKRCVCHMTRVSGRAPRQSRGPRRVGTDRRNRCGSVMLSSKRPSPPSMPHRRGCAGYGWAACRPVGSRPRRSARRPSACARQTLTSCLGKRSHRPWSARPLAVQACRVYRRVCPPVPAPMSRLPTMVGRRSTCTGPRGRWWAPNRAPRRVPHTRPSRHHRRPGCPRLPHRIRIPRLRTSRHVRGAEPRA